MEKSNQKRLEEYLVGANGYLKSDISNGKVIMLSGKWGSGKTYFWKNKIQTVLNDKDKKIPNHYISLYGKTSIEEIRNEVFLKIFESVDSCELEEKGTKLVKNALELISLFPKSMGIDLSKFTDKSFENLEKMLGNKKLKKTEEYLNSGAIICFDDFERKSKDIDLNDLFGFITQLTLNFSCKVVIILNDDVFEGEEKKIFTNVKEKSVSKFLKYEPNIKDLFDSIFNNDEKYRILDEYKQIILSTIQKTQELNARIYIQVLDNLVEWIGNESNIDENKKYTRYLILQNINFISNHHIYLLEKIDTKMSSNYRKETTIRCLNNNYKYDEITKLIKEIEEIENKHYYKTFLAKTKYIHLSNNEIQSMYFSITLESYNNKTINNKLDDQTFQKINNFIETGILINE